MNQSRSCLVDLAGLLSNVTALHTLFSIFAFRQTGRSDPAGLLIWCVCLSLTCGGLALFLRRPRTQRSILLLALAALALQGAVVWLWGVRYPSLLSWLCLLAMWGFSYFRRESKERDRNPARAGTSQSWAHSTHSCPGSSRSIRAAGRRLPEQVIR